MIFSTTVFGHESVLLTPGREMRMELGSAIWDEWAKMEKGEKAMMSSKGLSSQVTGMLPLSNSKNIYSTVCSIY